jgi:hypothetical protein
MGRHVAFMGEAQMHIEFGREAIRRLIGRPRRRLKYNIKINVGGEGWGGTDWIHQAQDGDQWRSVVNMVINFQFP